MRLTATACTLVLVLFASCQESAMQDPDGPPGEVARPQTIAEPMTEKGAIDTPSGEPSGRQEMATATNAGPDNGLPVPPAELAAQPSAAPAAATEATPAPAAATPEPAPQAAPAETPAPAPAAAPTPTTAPAPAAAAATAPAPIPVPTRDGQAHRYELRTFGTDVEVYMDGERVPADRIVIREGRVGVMDAKGNVIERMDLPSNWMQPESKPDASVLQGNPYDFRTVGGVQLTPPKVMLGARLVDVPDHLLAHIEAQGGQRERNSLVTEVIKGLPLDKAGIKDHDIIVAVNDIPDADPDAIRAVVRTLQPGDPINFRVLRNGKTFDARVEVAAWDPKHMVRPVGMNPKNIRMVRDAGPAARSAPAAMPAAAPAAVPAPNDASEALAAARAEADRAASDARAARERAEAAEAKLADAAAATNAARADLGRLTAEVAAMRELAAKASPAGIDPAQLAAAKDAAVKAQSELDATKAALAKASADMSAAMTKANADLAAARAQADAAAKAAATAAAAQAAAPAPAPVPANADAAQLRAALDRANARLAQLEKEARANDQVRRAIRPAPAPQPAPAPAPAPAKP